MCAKLSEEHKQFTHWSIDDNVLATNEESRLGRIRRVGDILYEQCIVRPDEMPMNIVRNPDFCSYEIVE